MSNDLNGLNNEKSKKPKSLIDFFFEILVTFVFMMLVFTLLNLNHAILHYLYGISSITHDVLILIMLTFATVLQLFKD